MKFILFSVFTLLLSSGSLAAVTATSSFNETELLSQLEDGFKLIDITAHDGITLKSIVFDPTPSVSGGKNPTIVFISSWGMNKWEYVVPANTYAKKGYTVLSYTARGFWESGGEINMAGLLDQADVVTAIDWVIANTNADPSRIGMSGISYGGGLSLLGSAVDSRVKSVASMSCWVDLAQSFLGNGETIRKEAVEMLNGLAIITGKPSDELTTLFADYFANTDLDYLYDMTYNSSAGNFLEQINAHKPAVFIANALGDSLFTPNQFPSFFNSLDLPKHLEFAPGDHAGPELPGLIGLYDQVWSRAYEWMDNYLLNNNSGEYSGMPQVVFNAMNGDEIEGYSCLSEVSTGALTFSLNKDEQLTLLDSSAVKQQLQPLPTADDVIASVTTGENGNLNGGVAFISSTVRAYFDSQKPTEMATIRRKNDAVFVSERFEYSYRFRGLPTLNLSFIPPSSNGTLIVYLLSVDNLNFGHLFTFSPWTYKNAAVGEPLTLSMELTMTSYDMPAKHRLAVVVGTHDMLFLDQGEKDLQLQFTGGSLLTMPINA